VSSFSLSLCLSLSFTLSLSVSLSRSLSLSLSLRPLTLVPSLYPRLPTTTRYVVPSGYIHFFLFFIPALVAPGRGASARRAFALTGFISGPILSMALSRGRAYAYEWSSIWCTFSVAQSLCLIVAEARARSASRAKRARADAGGGSAATKVE
jgi:hypothetical protein